MFSSLFCCVQQHAWEKYEQLPCSDARSFCPGVTIPCNMCSLDFTQTLKIRWQGPRIRFGIVLSVRMGSSISTQWLIPSIWCHPFGSRATPAFGGGGGCTCVSLFGPGGPCSLGSPSCCGAGGTYGPNDRETKYRTSGVLYKATATAK